MANLTTQEKHRLEKLFRMGDGYVLDFSNRSFAEFVFDSAGKDIYDAAGTYARGGDSKANRLRSFWRVEPNHVVGTLIADLVEHTKGSSVERGDHALVEDCRRIAERLQAGAPVSELAAIAPQTAERSLELLASEVKSAIESNQPEAALDRLHTYAVSYVRKRCDERGIAYDKKKPLHSLFGQYASALKDAGLIDSKMGVRIIRSVGQAFDTYNDVRNNHSLAHDNPVLGYDEALLICNHVSSVIRFLNAVEARAARDNAGKTASF